MSGHHHQHEYHPLQHHQEEEGDQNTAVFTFPSNNVQYQHDPHQIRRPENSITKQYDPAAYETAGMLSEMFNFTGPPPPSTGSTLHMLLPSPPNQIVHPNSNNAQFWGGEELGGIIEGQGQGLSLSLSSSLQFAADEFYHGQIGPSNSSSTNNPANSSPRHFFKHLAGPNVLQGVVGASFGPGLGEVHMGFGSPPLFGGVNVLRSSKYAKAAQELLEEFCSVGRGSQLINNKAKLTGRQNQNPNQNQNQNQNPNSSNECGGESTSSKDQSHPPLSPADRIEHQRRKVKLLSMIDEVDRRYNHYCEQMQMVVNSFDMVMGYGGSMPYTGLAHKAMSRHFRCLKDGIQTQLSQSCSALGEKETSTGNTGLTKGETPRLKMLEQSLRQQRAFHNQMGNLMDQTNDGWRPQRGLPERSVNLLRAWLFEHFLHPYPSDADKHLLSRQTGLSRNQVANWFINARVRLWKPMIEDMYQQESKEVEEDKDEDEDEDDRDRNQTSPTTFNNNNLINTTTKTQTRKQEQAQNPILLRSSSSPSPHINTHIASTSVSTILTDTKISSSETMTMRGPPLHLHHHHIHTFPPAPPSHHQAAFFQTAGHDSDCQDNAGPTTMIRFGTTPGDVSLTLGLRHPGNNNNNNSSNNAPDKTPAFSLGDFRSC